MSEAAAFRVLSSPHCSFPRLPVTHIVIHIHIRSCSSLHRFVAIPRGGPSAHVESETSVAERAMANRTVRFCHDGPECRCSSSLHDAALLTITARSSRDTMRPAKVPTTPPGPACSFPVRKANIADTSEVLCTMSLNLIWTTGPLGKTEAPALR